MHILPRQLPCLNTQSISCSANASEVNPCCMLHVRKQRYCELILLCEQLKVCAKKIMLTLHSVLIMQSLVKPIDCL